MSVQRRKEIASKGGRVAQSSGLAHRWTVEEAQEAGRRGGLKSRRWAKQQAS